MLEDTLINLGIHFSVDDYKQSRPSGNEAALNHDAPSTTLQQHFYSVLRVLPKQLSISFNKPQNIFPFESMC